MKPAWGGNRGRGRGSRSRGRGWRGNSSGPPRAGPPLLPMPMEFLGGPPIRRGLRGGYRGGHRAPPPDNFNQPFPPHSNEPPWTWLRGRPYSSGMLPNYSSGPNQRRPFLSPPHSHQSPVRPSSPLPGSEEYMQRDISEKSAFLKRQLELEGPGHLNYSADNKFRHSECDFASDTTSENFCDNNPFILNTNLTANPVNNVENKRDLNTSNENALPSPCRNKQPTRRQKSQQALSIEEIHDKIINHISNLSHGKKVNLVNQAGPSGYDIAVQQITRQKRLELSKALRDMCNNKFKETGNSSEVIQAIIPDFDIKIEELPREFVERLSSTLNEDIEERIQTMCIDPEVMFQQAADMLNTMLDGDGEIKNDVNLSEASTSLEGEFSKYSKYQGVDGCGTVNVEKHLPPNTGDPNKNFVPNSAQIQPGCSNMQFEETTTANTANFHNVSISCQSSAVDFSVPPPMNFSVPPPINFGIPPPSLVGCQQSNKEPFSFADLQPDNNLNISVDSYNTAHTQIKEGSELYPEASVDGTQYYSPGHVSSDENSLQTMPVFNDLMMGQDLLSDNNIEQADLSLPLNDEISGILLPTNSCDNPPFNLMGDQESDQYFDLNVEVDEGILMQSNEQSFNLIPVQEQLPENLTEPSVDEADGIIQPSEPNKTIKEGKAIILSDILIPASKPVKVAQSNKVSDVLTEAAELEACLAQGEADLNFLDTSKSKKICFTFNKTNNVIKSKILEEEMDDTRSNNGTSKKLSSPAKRTNQDEAAETKIKAEIKNECIKCESDSVTHETMKLEIEETVIEEKPQIKFEEKVNLTKLLNYGSPEPNDKLVDETVVSQFKKSSSKDSVIQQPDQKNVDEKLSIKTPTKEERDMEIEKLLEIVSPEKSRSASVETNKSKEKLISKHLKHVKKIKSRSKSEEKEVSAKGKDKKSAKKSLKAKTKYFEAELVEKKKEKKRKGKSNEIEDYSKLENYKSKFERSRYDIFHSQKYEDGYKKKYKEKSMNEEDRYRRSDSDRSFEKHREKFRSSDSDHSESHRFPKYHTEKEDLRPPKRYYHDSYSYRTEYGDYKNDYPYSSQKYGYAADYYSRQESPYSPEEFEPKVSHHTQKHKSRHEKSHKKRSKKHKRQRDRSTSSLSSISSSERDSSTSSLNKKTKHKTRYSDPYNSADEKSTSKSHKIPLKERIQMLHESKFERKRESSYSDYDENRKIKSEPVSPEVSRQPSPERSRSVEKLQSKKESLHQANSSDLREALNLKALNKSISSVATITKSLVTKTNHPATPVVPFTNKPCPARKQVEDPQREREEMIMNRDNMIPFRNKPCPVNKNLAVAEELEMEKEQELQLAKELPDIDNIAKIISNLSTIVQSTKDPPKTNIANSSNEKHASNKSSVKFVETNKKPERVGHNEQEKTDSKRFVQRPWKSPGEKKFMMEHLRRNPAYEEEELDYEPDLKSHDSKIFVEENMDVDFSDEIDHSHDLTDEFVVLDETTQDEKLAYLNPEPTTEEPKASVERDAVQTEHLIKIRHQPSENSFSKTEEKKANLSCSEEFIKACLSFLQPVTPNVQIESEIQNDIHNQNVQYQNNSDPSKSKPDLFSVKHGEAVLKLEAKQTLTPAKETGHHQCTSDSRPTDYVLEEIISTSQKVIKTAAKIEKSKEVEANSQITSEVRSNSTDVVQKEESVIAESTVESKESNKSNLKLHKSGSKDHSNKSRKSRSKSRSRSKTKEFELLHSAEVSSTSDSAAKYTTKPSVKSTSRSRSKSTLRSSTPLLPKEGPLNICKSEVKAEQPMVEDLAQAVVKPEDAVVQEKMLITTYTQTQADDSRSKKVSHKSKKDSKKDKTRSSSSHKSEKSKSRSSAATQTSVTNSNTSTQTPSARYKSVHVQMESEENKLPPKKSAFVQTVPVVIFDEIEDLDDQSENADKSGRKILKAVRRKKAIERMFDLDKEIERLLKLKHGLYKWLNSDSDSDEDSSFSRPSKVARLKTKYSVVQKSQLSENTDTVDLDKQQSTSVGVKLRTTRRQTKKSNVNEEKQNELLVGDTSVEKQSLLPINMSSLKSYKRDSKKEAETLRSNDFGDAVPEGTCKTGKLFSGISEKTDNMDSEKTVPIISKNEISIGKPSNDNTESKINSDKSKISELKRDSSKNSSNTNSVRETPKLNEEKVNFSEAQTKSDQNSTEEIVNKFISVSSSEIGIEKLTSSEKNCSKSEDFEKKNEELQTDIASSDLQENLNQCNITDEPSLDTSSVQTNQEAINKRNSQSELKTPEENSSYTNTESLSVDKSELKTTSRNKIDVNVQTNIIRYKAKELVCKNEEKQIPPEANIGHSTTVKEYSTSNFDVTANTETEENITNVTSEVDTPHGVNQPEKPNSVSLKTENTVRSTRSKQRKLRDVEQTTTPVTQTKRRQRRKTESESRVDESDINDSKQTPSHDTVDSKVKTKRKYRRKAELNSKLEEHGVQNTDANELQPSKSRRRSDSSKSPKRSKENKTTIKEKPSNEHKSKSEESLKKLKEVKIPVSRRRKRTTVELSADDCSDEISKTIEEVIRNESGKTVANLTAGVSPKLRGKDKAAEETEVQTTKSVFQDSDNFKESYEGSRSSFLDGKITEISKTLAERKLSDLRINRDASPDNSAFRGFNNSSEPEVREFDLAVAEHKEIVEASSKLNENLLEAKEPQKQKKRKRMELDPEIDSQNLFEIHMIKKPKNPFELGVESDGGLNKKKRRYPFSGIKSGYRTKKRKASVDTNNKSASLLKRKLSVEMAETESCTHSMADSVVRITRYSLSQLEEMRRGIRKKKEPANNNSDLMQTETSATDFSEDHQEKHLTEKELEEKAVLNAYNLKIVSIESLRPNVSIEFNNCDVPTKSVTAEVSHETNTGAEYGRTPMQLTEICDVIEEEIHLKEEINSFERMDLATEMNLALNLETSNETFEDFVKDSIYECSEIEATLEPPVLTPEVEEFGDIKNVLAEGEDYKMDFKGFTGAILVIKVIASTAIAASDKGKVFCFNMVDGTLVNSFDMSKLAITSMIVIKKGDAHLVYVGSLDSCIGIFNFDTKQLLKHEKTPEPVQCMEYAWNCIFIGSDRGSLIRYDLNAEKVEEAMKISDFNVLVIKATQEGPRKVLVVATRNAPVSIRDASSGLLLRTMETPFSPTVYTLLFEKNLIYCGTSQHDILVYTFEDGQLIFKHEATKSKGVVCMQIVGNLLFAGCYNGNIYVYNTKTNIHLGTMNGPGGLMLSMEIVHNKIIVGTKSSNFRAWRIPQKYLDQM